MADNQITYFFRHIRDGVSIGRVFDMIDNEIKKNKITNRIYMQDYGASPLQMLKNLFYVYKNRNRHGVNHITGAIHYLSLALPRNRTITTVHDVGKLDNQDAVGLKRLLFKLLFILPLMRNKYIVCVSEFTKNRLLIYLPVKADRIVVISNPVPEEFKYTPQFFNEEKPVILHVGTGENKNLKRTAEALEGMSIHLRIIGEMDSETKTWLDKHSIEYSNVCNIPDQDMMEEYKKCDIVNFSSLYEGFGMPIIEGQAIGRVVITSNKEPMKSVAGEGAFFVDPTSVDSIRDAYKVVMSDRIKRENVLKYAQVNVEKYKVSRIAQAYLDLYNRIL